MQSTKAELILENGMRFEGTTFGNTADVVGEVVFSTSMTGYQEAITDSAFCGHMVVLTYPLIGNYGINSEDIASDKPALTALIVREKCDYPNNFRAETDLDSFMRSNNIVGIEGIDTRALTRVLRDSGSMKGIITTKGDSITDSDIKQMFDSFDNSDAVSRVSTKEVYEIQGTGKHVAMIDVGVRRGILDALKKRGCKITVFPYNASADDIMASKPDLVMVSSGPGNPDDAKEAIETVKALAGKIPLRGISLGHLIIGKALGAETKKMKFGHHGANQPVRNTATGHVAITSQSHGYVLEALPDTLEMSYVNVNDNTCEGVKGVGIDVQSVQFHPEASPGPLETTVIIDDFLA